MSDSHQIDFVLQRDIRSVLLDMGIHEEADFCLICKHPMQLEKLFGSKTKTDILKYLVFRRQGISMRAFETDLQRSFPAIKKQIDQLEEAGVVSIKKQQSRRSIYLTKGVDAYIKDMFVYILTQDLIGYFTQAEGLVDQYFLGKIFGHDIDMDLVLVYYPAAAYMLPEVKERIADIFRVYLIEHVRVVFLSSDEFDQRYRLADKFVLGLMRGSPGRRLEK